MVAPGKLVEPGSHGAVAFEPVAGFVPKRSAIHYLSEPHGMEIWLVPIIGTRVMVPYRAQIETPVGLGVIEAAQFVAVAGCERRPYGRAFPAPEPPE